MVELVGDVQAVADKLASAKKHVSHSNVCFPPRPAGRVARGPLRSFPNAFNRALREETDHHIPGRCKDPQQPANEYSEPGPPAQGATALPRALKR